MPTYKLLLTNGDTLYTVESKFPYIGARKIMRKIHNMYNFGQEFSFSVIDITTKKVYKYLAVKLQNNRELTINSRTFLAKYKFVIKPRLII